MNVLADETVSLELELFNLTKNHLSGHKLPYDQKNKGIHVACKGKFIGSPEGIHRLSKEKASSKDGIRRF